MADIFKVDRTNNTITLGTTGTVTNLPFLTASKLLALDGSKNIVSTDLNSWVAGTANQITVTDEGDGTITLSTPQDIHTGASPQFTGIELGHASDTTITRVSAGVIAIEGTNVMLVGDAPTTHAMSTHTDEDTYNISTSGTLGAGNATLGTVGCGAVTGTSTAIFEGASVSVGKASTTTGTLVLYDSESANTITLTVPDITAGSLTFTLPPTDGANTNVLQTDGNGVLTWVAATAADSEKVKVDVGATADYIGAANSDGALRTTTGLSYADGGNFVTLGLSHLGFEALTDPGADRIPFWDNGGSAFGWLTVIQGVQIQGTVLQFDINSLTEDTTPATDDFIVTYDVDHGVANYEQKKVLISNFPNLNAFGESTDEDDDSATLIKAHAYLANQDGIVTAYATAGDAGEDMAGYVGTDNDPAGNGNRVAIDCVGGTNYPASITFPVASGKYFEITGAPAITIWWHPVGTLIKPTDQEA